MVRAPSLGVSASLVVETRPLNQKILAVEILKDLLHQRENQRPKANQVTVRVNHPGLQVVENATVESLLVVIDNQLHSAHH
jgi:hypothetical protein